MATELDSAKVEIEPPRSSPRNGMLAREGAEEITPLSPDEFRDLRHNLLQLWSIQDSLLQSYRMLSFALQTVLLSSAVGLLALSTKYPLIIVVLVVVGVVMLFALVRVTRARGINVSMIQAMLLKAESNEASRDWLRTVTVFKTYQKRTEAELEQDGLNVERSPTRVTFDTYVPLTWLVAWVGLLVICLWLSFVG